jgi:hypothetical protein
MRNEKSSAKPRGLERCFEGSSFLRFPTDGMIVECGREASTPGTCIWQKHEQHCEVEVTVEVADTQASMYIQTAYKLGYSTAQRAERAAVQASHGVCPRRFAPIYPRCFAPTESSMLLSHTYVLDASFRYNFDHGKPSQLISETHFGMAFYRAMLELLEGNIVPSPGFGKKGRKGGGAVDLHGIYTRPKIRN